MKKNSFNKQCITFGQWNMIYNSRIFWRRYTSWIRAFLISSYAGIGTAEEVFSGLYIKTSGIGTLLQIIYGLEDSNRLSELINQFTITLRSLVSAQLQGDREAVYQNVDRLFKSADNIVTFLASINPYINETEWRNFMEKYVQYTLEEANALSSGNYSKDIEVYNELTNLTNQMGYNLAESTYEYINSGLKVSYEAPSGMLNCISYEEMNQLYNIRMVWFELVTWIRAYMLSRYSRLGNENEVRMELRRIPAEFVSSLEEIFGEQVQPLLPLMNTYLDLIEALITAQIESDIDEINRITQLLYQNADQRAEFLAALNPYWDQNEWRRRLYENLRGTINESTTFLTKEYARNIDIFDTLQKQADDISNYTAQGLINYITGQ